MLLALLCSLFLLSIISLYNQFSHSCLLPLAHCFIIFDCHVCLLCRWFMLLMVAEEQHSNVLDVPTRNKWTWMLPDIPSPFPYTIYLSNFLDNFSFCFFLKLPRSLSLYFTQLIILFTFSLRELKNEKSTSTVAVITSVI